MEDIRRKYDNYDDIEDLVNDKMGCHKFVDFFKTTLDTQTFWQKVDIRKPQYVRRSVTKNLHEPNKCLNRLWTFEWTTGERVGDDCELQQFLSGCWQHCCWRWEMELWNWHRMRTALGRWIPPGLSQFGSFDPKTFQAQAFWPYNFPSSS